MILELRSTSKVSLHSMCYENYGVILARLRDPVMIIIQCLPFHPLGKFNLMSTLANEVLLHFKLQMKQERMNERTNDGFGCFVDTNEL